MTEAPPVLEPAAGDGWLDYRLRWRAGGARPGRHGAAGAGNGGNFQGVRPFWQVPDARRIDIRRSIADPAGELLVRQTQQRSAITVMLALDLSRSMRPDTDLPPHMRSVLPAAAMLAQAACRSALRAGDAFGAIAFSDQPHPQLSLPPTRLRGALDDWMARLRSAPPGGRSADGLRDLAPLLPTRRCLLLLVSDFRMPPALLEQALPELSRHDVAPVWLTIDPPAALPRTGLLRLTDAERGGQRLVLMRPALHRRWCDAEQARRTRIATLLARHGRPPFVTGARIDLSALSQHLSDG